MLPFPSPTVLLQGVWKGGKGFCLELNTYFTALAHHSQTFSRFISLAPVPISSECVCKGGDSSIVWSSLGAASFLALIGMSVREGTMSFMGCGDYIM